MNINRRKALDAGISYGSGCLNFGNDSIVYNRELLKLPDDKTYTALRDAIDAGDMDASKAATEALQDLCGKMALSQAYLALKPIADALEEDSLPSVDELKDFGTVYRKAISFLTTI